ncbi:unnamed protein product, partial [Brassica rapa]
NIRQQKANIEQLLEVIREKKPEAKRVNKRPNEITKKKLELKRTRSERWQQQTRPLLASGNNCVMALRTPLNLGRAFFIDISFGVK